MQNNPGQPAGKLVRNLVILALLAGVAALGVRSMRLQRERNARREAALRPAVAVAIPPREVAGPVTPPVVPVAPAAVPAAVSPTPAPSAAPTPESPTSNLATMAAQMLNNPAMRDMVAVQQRRAMELQYSAILDQLQFTPDQRTRFYDLMMESQSALMELGVKLMGGNLSPEEMEAVRRQSAEATTASQAKLAAFFAAEFPGDPGKFEAFNRSVASMGAALLGARAGLAGNGRAGRAGTIVIRNQQGPAATAPVPAVVGPGQVEAARFEAALFPPGQGPASSRTLAAASLNIVDWTQRVPGYLTTHPVMNNQMIALQGIADAMMKDEGRDPAATAALQASFATAIDGLESLAGSIAARPREAPAAVATTQEIQAMLQVVKRNRP